MKSIVEEASSIIKAIEKAWLRAEKPVSFQVKILEEPQKNFLGLTVRSAKIGLFFEEKTTKTGKAPTKVEPRGSKFESRKEKKSSAKERESCERSKEISVRKEKSKKGHWTQEMISASKEWLNKILATMGHSDLPYSVDVKGYYLNILFQSPVLEDKSREQVLFKSLSHLMMQMLRTKFKKGFVRFKIILKRS